MKSHKIQLIFTTVGGLLGSQAKSTRSHSIRQFFGLTLISLLITSPILANAEDFFVKTRGYRVEPEPDPPSYVRNLSKTQFEQFRDIEWLDVGLDHRMRFEYRENDYRIYNQETPVGVVIPRFRPNPDSIFLLRTRAYLGIHDILDPFRFVLEYQDSRSFNSIYPNDNGTTNQNELIQGYAELYFKNALGNNRPLSFRGGRMHLELLDRRLIGNNQFRNTTNTFQGFRIHFGKKQNDWDLDTFGLQPLERLMYKFDRAEEQTWIYGGVLSIRRWSEYITIQPYFIGRKQNGDPYNTIATERSNDRDIYAPGLRIYGLFGKSGFDFDADINKQFGTFGVTRTVKRKLVQEDLQHDAIGYAIELGYTWDHDWKPRTSVFFGYGSGDKDPNANFTSNTNDRFDPFYGFNQPWSRQDYYSWDNIITPKLRQELTPTQTLKVDAGVGAFWLASNTDGWNRTGLRDRTGKDGSFMGYEFDLRLQHQLNPYVGWVMSYGRYNPGSFTRDASQQLGAYATEPSNFFYFEVSLNAFGDGKPTL
jgi:hypothetical protein